MRFYRKFFGHLKTITKHKFLVMKYCFKLGLIKQGLLHDNSKWSPTEFWSSVKYYSGTRSPIDAEKEDIGYSLAWQHHKGHNPHHWEFWIDNIGPRPCKEIVEYIPNTLDTTPKNVSYIKATIYRSRPDALEIPINYVLEMICDWISAGKVYMEDKWTQSSPYDYYKKMENERLINPRTKILLERILISIKDYGIDYTFLKLKKSFMSFIDYEQVTVGINSWKDYMKSGGKYEDML